MIMLIGYLINGRCYQSLLVGLLLNNIYLELYAVEHLTDRVRLLGYAVIVMDKEELRIQRVRYSWKRVSKADGKQLPLTSIPPNSHTVNS